MTKTVIFDLGGVIVPLDFERGFAAMAERCPHSPQEIRKRLGATDLVARFESGRVSPADFHRQVAGMLSFDLGYPEFCRIWSSIFPAYTLIPESFIKGLKDDYFLVLLSNTNAIHFTMVRENYPILDHFHSFVLSYEVGEMKPSPKIFREAVARAGCRPSECFYTDDVAAYVEAAREEGIDAVQFTGFEPLRGEMDRRGIQSRG